MAKGDRCHRYRDGEVREMRNAETILGIIRERGRRGLPLEDVYRQLYNPALYLLAYGRISRNAGALTPGATTETVDGMSLKKIETLIDLLRAERFRWTPVRRVYIEKKHSTQKRSLGIPTWSDKLVQEVIRLILEAYYEPQFSAHSHGFRPERGCHTALAEIRTSWSGTAWFIEGDISQCFDKLDHQVLLQTLAEKIHDNRFLRLINGALKAGYLENWEWHATLSGSPQGGIVSPILANIYLDHLDKFVETTLLPAYNRGTQRHRSAAYRTYSSRRDQARKWGDWHTAATLLHQMQTMPSQDRNDPQFRRLHYVRYADDFLLGFAGPHQEAEEIKQQIGTFLRDTLKLELSAHKTLLTHARTKAARFLGYNVIVLQDDRKQTNGKRSINGAIGLRVPEDVLREKCAPYRRNGKPIHRAERRHDSVYSIISQYQTEYRGVVNYYQMAYNLCCFNRLHWVMETSLVKTLANKFRSSVTQVYKRYQTQVATPYGPYKALQVTVKREGKRPLVATWGGIPLRWKKIAVLNDRPAKVWNTTRTEVEQRLLADTCELCGSQEQCQVHHIKQLRTLQQPGRGPKPVWVMRMAARRRKTLGVCKTCHDAIHAEYRANRCRTHNMRKRKGDTGEPGEAKVSRPVRRGAGGKVPA
jgi:group II intron reverse transcriptase/maturase